MTREIYKLWVDYHYGIKKDFTADEKKEIFACEFAMHLLVPTKVINKQIKNMGGIEAIKNNPNKIKELANFYDVPNEVIWFKLNYMEQQKSKKNFVKRLCKQIHKRNNN